MPSDSNDKNKRPNRPEQIFRNIGKDISRPRALGATPLPHLKSAGLTKKKVDELQRQQDKEAAGREAMRKAEAGHRLSGDGWLMIRDDLKSAMRIARRAMRKAIKTGSTAKIGLSSTGEPDDIDAKDLFLEQKLLAVRVNKPLKSNRDLPLQPAIMAEFDEGNHGSREVKECFLRESETKIFRRNRAGRLRRRSWKWKSS